MSNGAWKLERFGEAIEQHSTKTPCIIAAMERGWVLDASSDFVGDVSGMYLADGVKIVFYPSKAKEHNNIKEG